MLNSPAFGLLGVGFALATWIVGGAVLGHYLDGRFETSPVLTLVFLVIGLAIGFTDAYRRLRIVVAKSNRKAGR